MKKLVNAVALMKVYCVDRLKPDKVFSVCNNLRKHKLLIEQTLSH